MSLVVAATVIGCSSDELVPDVTVDDTEVQTPATDTRTRNPPTVSNLPITRP